MMDTHRPSRRSFLAAAASTAGLLALPRPLRAAERKPALIAITLDLEMSRNFPEWELRHWDYEKGNLDRDTKEYTRQACQRVKSRGGTLHCFAVGRVLEQENVDWLREIAEAGHPIGNHTYDHVNVKATTRDALQFRFQRAPWLIEGKSIPAVIRQNIEWTNTALKKRVGVSSRGFRTPGGFHGGLDDRADIRKLLREVGFKWVSSKYPAHKYGEPGSEPGPEVYASIVDAQAHAQPYIYEDGLVELPMSPISDITAFRGGRWKLEYFLKAIARAVAWAIENGAVFDFLGHPSCLHVVDPEFRTIDLICDLVEKAGSRAKIVSLDAIAERTQRTAR